MMFLHEQNETEMILIVENLWPVSMVFKPLFFPPGGREKILREEDFEKVESD